MKLKAITKLGFFRKILGLISYLYIVLCYKTSRCYVVNDNQEKIDSAAIYAFWHGRLAMMPYLCPKDRKMNVLISSHSDGDIIKIAMSYFKFATISGSSKKNSFSALKQIIAKLKNNENVTITPDGSRGPAQEINSNIIEIARMAKVPIVPIIFSISSRVILNSWDRFMVPLPFGKIVLVYGKQIIVPENAHPDVIQDLKKQLAFELNKITKFSDEFLDKA